MTEEAMKLALEALEEITDEVFSPYDNKLGEAIIALREALAEHCQCPECQVLPHASDCAVHSGPAYPKGECNCGAQQEPEFFTHCVDQPYDWSEWVCPDPKSYLFKCCDCGLVHEAEFGVVRYKSDTDREDCDMVDDPNLQAVFRMRRSEQWSPADMAHRAGGLTMEQPAQQEPVAVVSGYYGGQCVILPIDPARIFNSNTALYTSPPQRTWVGLTDDEISNLWSWSMTREAELTATTQQHAFARTIEAKLKEKNT